MSQKTLYYCDKCKEECEYKELTKVRMELNAYNYKPMKFESSYKSYDLCCACTEKLGFVKKIEKEGEKTVEITTADKLYDLIATMIKELI